MKELSKTKQKNPKETKQKKKKKRNRVFLLKIGQVGKWCNSGGKVKFFLKNQTFCNSL